MANEGLYITILALMLIGVLLYAFASMRHSSFAATQQAVQFSIVTATGSYNGITSLISEFNKNHDVKGPNPVFWKDVSSDTFIPVSFKQTKDTNLTSKEVQIKDHTGTLVASFSDRETKNSVWDSGRNPTKRLPDFIALLKLKYIPDNSVVALTKANEYDPSDKADYAIYVATKTYDKSIVQLVRALNERADGLKKVASFKFTNPLPVRFYAATDGNLNPKQIAMYDNGSRVYISETRDLFLDDEIMSPDQKVNLFNKETGVLEIIKCPRTVTDVKILYPPRTESCPSTSYCYLLRARAPLSDCHKAAEALERMTNEYNKVKLYHSDGKFTRFYNGGVEPYDGPSEIFAAIDSSNNVIRENMSDVYYAMENPANFEPMRNRLEKYMRLNMKKTNPRQYV